MTPLTKHFQLCHRSLISTHSLLNCNQNRESENKFKMITVAKYAPMWFGNPKYAVIVINSTVQNALTIG